MSVVLVNASSVVPDSAMQVIVPALQTQVTRDLALAWPNTATTVDFAPKDVQLADEMALIILNDSDQAEALGYHDLTANSRPIGKVFVRSCQEAGEDWCTCASHELLEMLCDPNIDRAIHTMYNGKPVITIQEVCDPVEGDTYPVGAYLLSNFVLSPFYGQTALPGTKYDFLGRLSAPMTMDPGGYMSFQDAAGNWTQVFGERVTTWRAKSPLGSRRERLRAGAHRWRKSTAI